MGHFGSHYPRLTQISTHFEKKNQQKVAVTTRQGDCTYIVQCLACRFGNNEDFDGFVVWDLFICYIS